MKFILLLFFLSHGIASGFIPPVTSILREIYDSRKVSGGIEAVFQHRVMGSDGGWVEVDEKVLSDKSGIKFLWKPSSLGTWVSGIMDKRSYVVGNEKRISSRSLLFLKNYLSVSAADFRDALINERFLKWEQLKQFKDGFELQGEPQTWDIKNNYLEHDTISLALLPTGPSIAVVGSIEPSNKRVIYFDKGLLGVKKIEWIDGLENTSWNFDGFSMMLKESYFPKRSVLTKDGRDVIQTDVSLVRSMNQKQIAEWLQSWQKASKGLGNNTSAEESLKNLLSFR